jgi:phosphosulfolactate synthase
MRKCLLDDLLPSPTFTKPRELRQTWLKDLGFHEEEFGGKMGLVELTDFLEVAAPRLDFVKFLPAQAINSPRDWFMRKVGTYIRHRVVPYLDHSYFQMTHALGKLEQAIVAARELGVPAMEFMNVGESISPQRLGELVRFAAANDVHVIFEFHPFHKFDPSRPTVAGTGEDVLRAAMPALDAGAIKLMVDHMEFDVLGERAEVELGKVVAELGLARVVFEVESLTWRQHLERYLQLFGPDANLANFVPGEVMHVEPARKQAVMHSR